MADVKTVAPPSASAKDKFLSAGKAAKPNPARPRAKKLSDTSARYIKIGLYGDFGTGKTFALVDLIEQFGLKVLVVSTDVGGDGLNTVIAELKRRGRADLADTHIYNLTLEAYDDFVDFTNDPQAFFPEIYEWDPDLLAHDGASAFQQNQIVDYVEDLDVVRTQTGTLNTNKFWNEIRSATTKNLNRFLYMHNKKTGKLWHKFVTYLVNDVGKEENLLNAADEKARQAVKREVKVPFIQGSAAKLIGPAFDFFARTSVKRVANGETADGKTKYKLQFVYNVEPNEKQKAKVRGVAFEPVIPGDMGVVWGKLVDAYMVQPAELAKAEDAV